MRFNDNLAVKYFLGHPVCWHRRRTCYLPADREKITLATCLCLYQPEPDQ